MDEMRSEARPTWKPPLSWWVPPILIGSAGGALVHFGASEAAFGPLVAANVLFWLAVAVAARRWQPARWPRQTVLPAALGHGVLVLLLVSAFSSTPAADGNPRGYMWISKWYNESDETLEVYARAFSVNESTMEREYMRGFRWTAAAHGDGGFLDGPLRPECDQRTSGLEVLVTTVDRMPVASQVFNNVPCKNDELPLVLRITHSFRIALTT